MQLGAGSLHPVACVVHTHFLPINNVNWTAPHFKQEVNVPTLHTKQKHMLINCSFVFAHTLMKSEKEARRQLNS
jgi:hypothetical protein